MKSANEAETGGLRADPNPCLVLPALWVCAFSVSLLISLVASPPPESERVVWTWVAAGLILLVVILSLWMGHYSSSSRRSGSGLRSAR